MVAIQGVETIKDTTKGFAARWGVDYATAAGLMNFLKAKNVATETGDVEKVAGTVGKGSKV